MNALAEVVNPAEAALANRHGRPFIKSVRTFVSALKAIPDTGPSEYTHENLGRIRDLAERVIAEIDDRLEDADDPPRVQQELATTVYTIRKALEEVNRWERHYRGVTRS
jgi:hypothetical protein